MKKFATCIATSIALLGANAAHAQTYTPGTHTFSGSSVGVQKDGLRYVCTLNVTVSATATSATATASLSGGFPCALISVTGTGTVSVSGNQVTLTGLTIDPPISSGLCTGPITVVWGGNTATPRTLTASVPLSNSSATGGAPCKLDGVIRQTSSPALNIN